MSRDDSHILNDLATYFTTKYSTQEKEGVRNECSALYGEVGKK